MGKRLTEEEFMRRFTESIHGELFDYSKVVYGGVNIKVEIICKIHGSFWQRPIDHWKGRGCDKCGKKVYSWEVFKEKAKKKHDNLYSYPEQPWKDTRQKVKVICSSHGIFTQVASMHLHGQGCKECQLENNSYSSEAFLEKSVKAHGDYYDYTKVLYMGKQSKVIIVCPIHGAFTQRAEDHYSGHGCKKCNVTEGHLNKTLIERDPEKYKNRKGLLYLLRCSLGEESFYKIGITSQTVRGRYNSKIKMPYNYEIIKGIPMNIYDAFYLEQEIKDSLKEFRHYPKVLFGGAHRSITHRL